MEACAMSPENEETVDLELRVDEIVPNGVYFNRVSSFLGSTLVRSLDFKILRHNYSANHDYTLMEIRITKELATYKGLLVRDPCKEIETNKIVTKKILDYITLDLVFESESRSSIGRLVFADPYSTTGIISVLKTDLQILDRYMILEVIKDQPTLSNIKMMKIKMTRSKAIEYGLHKDPEVAKPNYIIADLGDGMGNIKHDKSERRFSMASSPVKDALVGIDYGKVETRLLGKISSKPIVYNYEHDINEGISFVDFVDEFLTNPIHTNTMSDEKYAIYRDSLKPKSREKVNRLRTEFRNFMSGNEK